MRTLPVSWLYAATVTCLFSFSPSALAHGAPTPAAHVVSMAGREAWLVRGKHKAPLQAGAEFHAGDILMTAYKTSAKLMLGNGEAAMLLMPNSVLWIHKTDHHSYDVSLKSGALLSTTGAAHLTVGTNPDGPTMNATDATFYVYEVPGRSTYFYPDEGKISVSSGNDKVDFDTRHHDSAKWIAQTKGALAHRMTAPAPKMDIGHTKAEISDLKKILK